MPMICSPCGLEIEDGTAAIYGVQICGVWHFRWTCSHHPIGDAEVILGSQMCTEKWLNDHPEHTEAIADLLAELETA